MGGHRSPGHKRSLALKGQSSNSATTSCRAIHTAFVNVENFHEFLPSIAVYVSDTIRSTSCDRASSAIKTPPDSGVWHVDQRKLRACGAPTWRHCLTPAERTALCLRPAHVRRLPQGSGFPRAKGLK